MIEVQLTANGFQLELYVDGYEFPEFDTGRDANALACEIELDLQRRLTSTPLTTSSSSTPSSFQTSSISCARSNTPRTAGRRSETQTKSQAISSA